MMRILFVLLILTGFGSLAQDFTTPRNTYTEEDVTGPDAGRGPAGWRVFRTWDYVDATHASGWISAFVVTSNGNQVFQFPNSNFNEGYQAFLVANAAASTPTEPGRVAATYSVFNKIIFPVPETGNGTEPNFICKFTAPPTGPSSYSFNVTYRDSTNVLMSTIAVNLNVPNTVPTSSLTASPSAIVAGGSTTFSPSASDPDTGQTITYSYNYGDGNTGSSATHTYASAGTYTCTVTASDGIGTSTATVNVTVYGPGNAPTARFEVSEDFITVGTPFTVSAVVSTDPQNQLASYAWSFGDGSTAVGMSLSHMYTSTGTVTITLTVTDAQGLTASMSQDYDVLDATAGSVEDATVTYDVRYNTGLSSKDYIKLTSSVNIGDRRLNNVSTCTVAIYGVTFGGTLNRRLKYSNGSGVTVVCKNGTRRQPYGTVNITLLGRNINGLGSALRSVLGALAIIDTSTNVVITVGPSGNTSMYTMGVLTDTSVNVLAGTAHGEY